MKSLQVACADDVIEMWLQRSHLLLDAHSNAARLYRTLHYFLGVSIIVLSGVMTLPHMQAVIPYFSSLIVIVASIYVFLGFNDTAERHRRAAKAYGEIMRGLESHKGFLTPDIAALRVIEDRINRANAAAPDIPLRIFRKREKKMLAYVGEMEQEKVRVRPRFVSNVSFNSHPTVSSGQLTEAHYRLEIEHFGKYAACPSTFDEFRSKNTDMSLLLTDARTDGNLVGYCLFERLQNALCHLQIVVVGSAYRRQGVGRLLVTAACEQLIGQGITRFSLFTAEDPAVGRLFRGVADPVSVGSDLTTDEVEVLSAIARHRGLSESEYGTNRIIQKYYTLRDGSTLDAIFKLYRL